MRIPNQSKREKDTTYWERNRYKAQEEVFIGKKIIEILLGEPKENIQEA